MLVKIVKYIGFYIYHRSYLLWSPVLVSFFSNVRSLFRWVETLCCSRGLKYRTIGIGEYLFRGPVVITSVLYLEVCKVVLCRVHTKSYRGHLLEYFPCLELLQVLYDIHVGTRNFCELYMTFIPVPDVSVSSVRPCHNTRGTGTTSHTLSRPLCRVNTLKIV